MNSAPRLSAALVFAFVLGASWGTAMVAAEPTEPESVEALLDNVEKSLQDLKAYSAKLDIAIAVNAAGNDQNVECDFDVKIDKPRRWAVVKNSGPIGGSSISDGKEQTTFVPMFNAYAVEPLPEEGASDPAAGLPMILLGPAGQVKAFMGEGLKEMLMEGVDESSIAGEEEIDGQACWRCEFKQEGLDWEMWVTKEDQPKPRRVIAKPDYSSQPGAPEGMSMTVQIDLTEFDADPKFTDEDFAFTPPEDAKKVDSIMDAMPGMGPRPPHVLVGEEAPKFEVESLDGEKFKLEDVIGKEVVMLDFWATWCAPCVAALPQISAAAEEMKEKGVVFFAVNLNEDAETVTTFLKEHELEVPVLMDTDGAVGTLYKAEAIPQTVLIGKDGRVQVVHVGFSGDAKKELIEELTSLLEGKELAKETLEKWEADQKAAEAESEEEAEAPAEETEEAEVEVDAAVDQ